MKVYAAPMDSTIVVEIPLAELSGETKARLFVSLFNELGLVERIPSPVSDDILKAMDDAWGRAAK